MKTGRLGCFLEVQGFLFLTHGAAFDQGTGVKVGRWVSRDWGGGLNWGKEGGLVVVDDVAVLARFRSIEDLGCFR